MRKYLDIALGIVTSVGGFLDAGAIATAAQAGAQFGYALIWAFLLGTVCVTVLVEMSGRLAAVPGAVGVWAVLWNGKFSWSESGVAVLGLSTLAFVVAAVMVRPDWGQVARGVLPSVPAHGQVHYWFLVVSIVGALISP